MCSMFYQMVQSFQVWPIKKILALFLFSASAYYRANWTDNAVIIVWMCWYGCQSVVCMRVIKCNWVCVLIIFERKTLLKSQIQPLCAPAEFCWHLTGKIWYKLNLTESSFSVVVVPSKHLHDKHYTFIYIN